MSTERVLELRAAGQGSGQGIHINLLSIYM